MITRNKRPSKRAEEAAQLEIAANYLRLRRESKKEAYVGHFVQIAIDEALEESQLGRGPG